MSRLRAKNNYGEKCWPRPIPYNSGPILQHIHLQLLLPQQELLHDYEHLDFWKGTGIQHQSNCYEQKVRMHGPILECGRPVLDLHLLHLFLPLFMPWVFMNPERKSSLTFVTACVLLWEDRYLQPVPLSIQYLSTWELYNHRLHDEDCPVNMWTSRIRKQQHIEQIIGSCKLECRI